MNRRRRFASILAVAVLAATATACRAIEVADPESRSWVIPQSAAPVADRADVAYGRDPAHRADIYRATGGEPRGTLIYVHGGAWRYGSRELDAASQLDALLKQRRAGWSFVSIGYPLGSGRSVDQVRSVSAAVNWVRRNGAELGIDTSRIVLVGYSAGATLAATVAVAANNPESPFGRLARVDGYISIAGPTDFTLSGHHGDLLRGAYLGRRDANGAPFSPITYVDDKDPAGYLIHGDLDNLVPVGSADDFAGRAAATIDKVDRDATGALLPESCRLHSPMCGANNKALNRWLRER